MIDHLIRFLLTLHGWPVLAVVFALPMLESSAFVGFIFPGEIAVLLGGVLASQHQISLASVLAAAACGAVLGDTIGYAVGYRWGQQLVHGALRRVLRQDHLARGERYLAQRGGKAVFLGRWVAALRVVMPGLAGMARMPYRTFVIYNVSGGVLWAVLMGLLGFFAGTGWQYVSHLASRIGLVLVLLLAVGFGVSRLVRAVRDRAPWLRRISAWWTSTRFVRWLRERFPIQWTWFVRRFDPGAPTGLALTGCVVVGVATAWACAAVTQDVLAQEETATLDPAIHAWVVAHRLGWLTASMRVVTWLGSGATLVPILLVASTYFLIARRSIRATVLLWSAYFGAVVLYTTFKILVARPRPPVADHLMHAAGAAFPSGHATQALAVWGMLALLLSRTYPRWSGWFISVSAVLVLLVGCSRIYLGVHWLTDVLGGLALGATWLAVLLIIDLNTRLQAIAPATDDGSAPSDAEPS